jgi:hypothetical protein
MIKDVIIHSFDTVGNRITLGAILLSTPSSQVSVQSTCNISNQYRLECDKSHISSSRTSGCFLVTLCNAIIMTIMLAVSMRDTPTIAQDGLFKAVIKTPIMAEKKKSKCKLYVYVHCTIFNCHLVVAKLPQLLWEPD